jgi:CheY-like chemotaxis protein/HPt (histidine-containing phosphotransfer) domain-containing protein
VVKNEAMTHEPPKSSPAAPGPQRLGSRRVLLAEDNEINQEIARAVLEAAGHRVDVVATGAEAVAAVASGDYDLVLMDIQMPVMDGITATRQIRALDGPARGVPVIAMTASILPQQVRSFFDAGMNGHVVKPFKREELCTAVERWAARPPVEPADAGLDLETFENILSLLGPEKTAALVDRLAQQVRGFDISGTPARAAVLKDAHAMISAAGLLGFTSLSALCREIEDQCLAGGDLTAVTRRMDEMRPVILREIERVKETIKTLGN